MLNRLSLVAAAGVAMLVAAQPAAAQFLRTNPGFGSTVTPRNDDFSFNSLDAGFTMSWSGTTTNLVGVNNNGYAALNSAGHGIVPCNPSAPCGASVLQLFNWDLDTRNGSTSPVTYGTSTVGGRNAFGANWFDIGYYSYGGPSMSFQLVLIDRSDIAVGDFDIEYNYGAMNGSWAMAGWTTPTAFFEIPGNNTSGASAAVANSRYLFQARGGVIAGGTHITTTTPEPATVALMGGGLALIGFVARRRRAA